MRGVASTIYEANPERIGGRCWTSRGWPGGQTAEHGGEFIDSRHRRIRALAKRFGLELTDLYSIPNPGSSRLWLDGALRRRSRDARAGGGFERRLAAGGAARRPLHSRRRTPRPRCAFDRLSVAEWLDAQRARRQPRPLGTVRLGARWPPSSGSTPTGSAPSTSSTSTSNRIRGRRALPRARGNDQLVAGLAAALPESAIELDARSRRCSSAPAAATAALRRRPGRGGRRPGRARDPVHDPAPGRPRALRAERPQAALHRRARHGHEREAADAVRAPAARLRRLERLHVLTTTPISSPGRAPSASPAAAASSTTYFGGRSGAGGCSPTRAHGPTLEREVTRNLTSLSSAGAPVERDRRRLHGRLDRPLGPTRGRAAPTPPSSPASTPTITVRREARGRDPLRRRAHRDRQPGLSRGSGRVGRRCADEVARAIL